MITVKSPLFETGHVVATPGALAAMEESGESVWSFISRHVSGDWGVLSDDDKELNNEALKDGSRLLSAYHLKSGQKIWIITEARDDSGQRLATTALLPDEY